MARLDLIEGAIVIRLTLVERLFGYTGGDGRVPLTAVRSAYVSERPWNELRGLRSPGVRYPGRAIGTWRWQHGRDFVALRGRGPAVVVELAGVEYTRLLVSDPFAASTAAEIDAAKPHP